MYFAPFSPHSWPKHPWPHSSAPIFTGWSQPPHPIDLIPSFDPRASGQMQARAVLYDYFHDNDLRSWADGQAAKTAFGVSNKADYDTARLIRAYENPHDAVWSGALQWADLNKAVQAAIARRTKLGPLPGVSSYDTDPVVIYYYDHDKIKKVSYPKSAISPEKGYALDGTNLYWWKGHDIHTYEWNGSSWGDEGFDWDKDVAGNIGTITATIMLAVGAILQIIPGIGTGIGAAIILLAPVVGALLGAADTAFQGGDMGTALMNIGQAIVTLGSKGLSDKAGIKMDDATVKQLGTSIGTLAADVAGLQKQGAKFTDIWNQLAQNASKYGKFDDATIAAIGKALGSDAAASILRKGYDTAQYASAENIQAMSQLFSDKGAQNLFGFGAGLGLLQKAQTQALSATMPTKGRSIMTHGIFTGADAASDAGSAIATSLANAFGQVLTTAAQQGAKALSNSVATPAQQLAAQVAILGPKYGVAVPAVTLPAVKTSGGGFAVGQCVLPDGSILPISGWNDDGSFYCMDPHGTRVDAQGHVARGISVGGGFAVGQCVLSDGTILPISGWDDHGNVFCMTPQGQRVDATGHAVGFQSSGPMYDPRFSGWNGY